MRIGTLEVAPNQPAALIAEIGNAHDQDLGRALRLLDAAKEAGASAAKLQCYSVEDLVALRGDGPAPAPWNSMTMRELYSRAMTPLEWFPELFSHARALDLPIFSSVFGPDGFAVLEAVGNPVYKLAALDLGKPDLRRMVQATGKPLIRSIPNDYPPAGNALMVLCPSGYPQTEFHLRALRNGFGGYSYHGTDTEVPMLAVACGAYFVECHFMLAEEPSSLESNVSLTQHQFAALVKAVRRLEEML